MPNVYDTGTSGVLNNMRCSDHLPIFTVRSTSKSIIDDTYRRKRNHSMKNISKFKKLLKANNWEDVYSHCNCQSGLVTNIHILDSGIALVNKRRFNFLESNMFSFCDSTILSCLV